MGKKKDRNFLVTVWDASGIELDAPINYIVSAKDEQEAESIVKETDEDEFQNHFISIQPLADIERLSRKVLSVQQVMDTISDHGRFEESAKLFEQMILDKKINYVKWMEIFIPYGRYLEQEQLVQPVPSLDKLWSKAITSSKTKIFAKMILEFLPSNKKPFRHTDQIYEIIIRRNGEPKPTIVFRHLGTSDPKAYHFVEFLVEVKKAITDLPLRIEQLMMQAM